MCRQVQGRDSKRAHGRARHGRREWVMANKGEYIRNNQNHRHKRRWHESRLSFVASSPVPRPHIVRSFQPLRPRACLQRTVGWGEDLAFVQKVTTDGFENLAQQGRVTKYGSKRRHEASTERWEGGDRYGRRESKVVEATTMSKARPFAVRLSVALRARPSAGFQFDTRLASSPVPRRSGRCELWP